MTMLITPSKIDKRVSSLEYGTLQYLSSECHMLPLMVLIPVIYVGSYVKEILIPSPSVVTHIISYHLEIEGME
ncbi:MAG: hypothetical protein SVK08_10545 [Halobacteriota archaeon]|nr:hypothetical protein [Halobacteriota archaeon]